MKKYRVVESPNGEYFVEERMLLFFWMRKYWTCSYTLDTARACVKSLESIDNASKTKRVIE